MMPPAALRWLITNALLMAAAHYFFFPPLEVHTRTAQRVSEAVAEHVQRVVAAWRAL
jgi:hypothetical protein